MRAWILMIVVGAMGAPWLWSQSPGAAGRGAPPRIGYVYPAGGCRGTTVTVVIGGQGLGPVEALVEGEGVRARFVALEQPLSQKDFQQLRDEAEALRGHRRDGTGAMAEERSPEEEARLREIRRQLMLGPVNRQPTPAIAERATLEITIAPGAAVGRRELRVRTERGLSNPLSFEIGDLPEVAAPPGRVEPTRRREALDRVATSTPAAPIEAVLPVVVNGQILPGEVDRMRFAARRGQNVVVAVAARGLIPYLADAVPGWVQATISVKDPAGRELAFADDSAFNPDPALMLEIPVDGEYVVEIADALFRGREDFVYRVTVGEVPFITGIQPLGGAAGEATSVQLFGWNLPTATTRVEAPTEAGTSRVAVRSGDHLSNSVLFEARSGSIVAETEPVLGAERQAVVAPVTVDGCIQIPNDADVYRVSGRPGASCVAEIRARRLNSPLDSVLRVTDLHGQLLGANDDTEDRGEALTTHHADSRVAFTLPADGACLVHVTDAQHRGGLEYGYRLRVAPPQPDFELRLVPSGITVRAGACAVVVAHVLRHDGFTGPVDLTVAKGGDNLMLSGARIPAGQDSVRFTIAASGGATSQPTELHVVGRAQIAGRTVAHQVVPADDMMQAFAYRHLVPARATLLDVIGGGGPRGAWAKQRPSGVLRIPAGGQVRTSVPLPRVRGDAVISFELEGAPAGIVLKTATVAPTQVDLTFAADRDGPAVGLEGNLIVQAFAERQPEGDKKGPVRRVPLGPLPAMPFQVVAR